MDNLSSQKKTEFVDKVENELAGTPCFGMADATDLWQPVDAGYAQTLKQLIAIEHREWLDDGDNADKWFNNQQGNPFTAKVRRILITHWAGQAMRKLNTSKYDRLRLKCWEATGALMTADGSEDDKIKPEGLPNYQVLPPLILDPTSEKARSNILDINPFVEETELPEEPEVTGLFAEEDELVEEGEEEDVDIEEEGDNNCFDFIDRLVFQLGDEDEEE